MKSKILFLLFAISNFAFCQIPATGLHSSYEFTNGSLIDGISGNSFTQTGTALTNTNDRFSTANNAIGLNGDYLNTGNIDYGETGSGNNTQVTTSLSFWVKTSSNNTQIETIIDESQRASTSTWYGYYIYLENGKIKVDARYQLERFFPSTLFTYKSILAESTSVIADGNWHHIVVSLQLVRSFQFTYDNEYTAKIYVDTVLEDTGYNIDSGSIVSPISHDVAVDFTIGNRHTGGLTSVEVYKDEIDDILVYNRLLTNTEITQIATDNSFCFAQSAADLTISNKTETSFDVSWPKDGNFELAYVLSGQPFSGATIIPVNGYTSGNLQSITGLTTSTNYDIHIREECNISSWSSWSNAKTTITIGNIYVNANATGNNDGFSWVNAYTNLEDALVNMGDNRDIWIAQGTYIPNNIFKLYNISTTGTKIYGGFNGTETLLSQRDIAANLTILSGDILGNDDTNITFNNATRSENSLHVIHVFSANNVLIDGITVTSGYADATDSSINRYGAGILLGNNTLNFTLKNSTIKENVAYWGSGLASTGFSGDSNITIENCTFDNNLCSAQGSAFYLIPPTNNTMDVTVANCLLKNNKTTDNGARVGNGGSAGSIRAFFGGSLINATIINNTIVNNTNEGTGTSDFSTFGLGNTSGSFGTVTLANNIFWGNNKNGGLTTLAFGRITDTNTPTTISTVYNSIDEDDFSNFTSKVATTNSDPLFTSYINEDYTLQSSSPGINSGNNSYVPVGITSDLLGNARINNTTVDMGAYEYGVVLGIPDNHISNSLTVFPNPTRDYLHMESPKQIEKIEVYTYLGQKVIESGNTSIETHNLSNGIYFLKVYTNRGEIGVKRFVKE